MLTLASPVIAGDAPLPPPPEAPAWVEPRPLDVGLTVLADGCDSGPEDSARINHFTTSRKEDGLIHVEGWVEHNGAESVDSDWAQAWEHDGRLLLAYRLRPETYPESPVMMCFAYSELRFEVDDIDEVPDDIRVFAGRFRYSLLQP